MLKRRTRHGPPHYPVQRRANTSTTTIESAIPKVVAAHVAAANGNGKSDPSTYVDQTPAT